MGDHLMKHKSPQREIRIPWRLVTETFSKSFLMGSPRVLRVVIEG